jgi:hypothetical protein
VLVFLHADSTLPVGFDAAALAALAEPGVAMCAFRFALAPAPSSPAPQPRRLVFRAPRRQKPQTPVPLLGNAVAAALMEWAVHVRSSVFEMP